MNNMSVANVSTPDKTLLNKTEIEKILGLPFTKNNNVRLLQSGLEVFQSILDAVSTAQRTICIEFYIFKDDDTGNKLSSLLKEKSRQGVSVYLLYDHFGSFLTARNFWSALKKEGVKVRVSHPFKLSSLKSYIYRDHKKLLIIDGQKAFMGGFNIADEYHRFFRKKKKIWRDMGIYLEGPITSSLLDIFSKSWKTWKGELIKSPPEHRQPTHGVPVIPIFVSSARTRRKMRRLLLYSIKNSKESILLTTAYFIPSRRILMALINAAQRGVNLKLLLPGKTDVLSVFYAGRSYYTRLLKAGVEIYNYQGAVLHSKTSVFDGCWSVIGSANLDFQSLRRNEESNVGIFDREFSRQITEVFQNDLKSSIKIDPETWSRRPLHQKFLEKFFSLIMRKL